MPKLYIGFERANDKSWSLRGLFKKKAAFEKWVRAGKPKDETGQRTGVLSYDFP